VANHYEFEMAPFRASPSLQSLPSPLNISITGTLQITHSHLSIQYFTSGDDILEIRWPNTSQNPRFQDELWRNTCFELFIAPKHEPSYLEYNFSPSRHWAVYAFKTYRQRKALDYIANININHRRANNERVTDINIVLQSEFQNTTLNIGVSAVIESNNGDLYYYALTHKGGSPDFHLRESFILELQK